MDGLEAVLHSVDRFRAMPPNAEAMSVVEWDVSAHRGATARLIVRDAAPRGHIGIDDVRLRP